VPLTPSENARAAVEQDPYAANDERAALFRKTSGALRPWERRALALGVEFARLATEPNAAELVSLGWPVEEALRFVDERARDFERKLGIRF
jgi:hypothetical protein